MFYLKLPEMYTFNQNYQVKWPLNWEAKSQIMLQIYFCSYENQWQRLEMPQKVRKISDNIYNEFTMAYL